MARRSRDDDEEEEPGLIESAVRWWGSLDGNTQGAIKAGLGIAGLALVEHAKQRYAQPPAPPPPPPVTADESTRHSDALLLGCAPYPATEAEVKTAFRRRARELHPDRSGGDTESMKVINLAYGRHLQRVPPGKSR